jgi:adenine-specific DNA-methyltransferase
MKKICNEVFGEDNFLAQVVWERAFSPVNLKKHFSESHDFILCYAKEINSAVCNGLPRSGESDSRYSNPDNDPRGPWTSGDLSVGPAVESRIYEIITPSGRKVMPPSGYCWRLDQKTFEQYKNDNRIWFGESGDNVPRIKRFLSEVKQGITPMTIWKYTDVGSSQDATKELKKIFDGKAFFDYPKPVELIKRCIELYADDSCIVMDFFSGSATTAQAVMELNADDGGQRRFILVQCAENNKENGEAFKAGYKTICDIGEERIRRTGKIAKEKNPGIDTGFRVLYLDDSNMNDVYYAARDYHQDMLSLLESNVKSDRSDIDLLFSCLLEWGLPLSLPYSSEKIGEFTIHTYNDGDLIACFDENISDDLVKVVAKRQPLRAVFRDSSFNGSPSKINVGEIFKMLAPDTRVKVI